MGYYLSYGNLTTSGLMVGNGYHATRNNVRMKLNTELFDRLTIEGNVSYTDVDNWTPASSDSENSGLFYQALRSSPLTPVKFTDGQWGYGGSSANPIAQAYDGGFINYHKRETSLNFSAGLRIIDGLTAKVQYATRLVDVLRKQQQNIIQHFYPDTETPLAYTSNTSKFSQRDIAQRYQNVMAQVDYDKTIGKHSFHILAGFSQEWQLYQQMDASRQDLVSNDLHVLNAGTDLQTNSGYDNHWAIRSGFGRVNYNFNDRYLVEANLRYDLSSRFHKDHRGGYFPSASVAWRLTEESFMESTRSWLDNLKLRLSYGMAGADNIDASLWRETWESTTVTFNGQTYSGYKPSGMLSNPDLKWETTISRNIGLDFGFFNNRLSGTIDAYWNTTKDLLMCIPIDETTGYSYQYQNIGQTSNKGIEIALNYDILRTKDFTLGVSATYNYNHNNIDELADNIIAQYGSQWASSATTPTYDYEFREGKPVGLIRGYICDGYYTTADFNYDPATKTYTLKPGVADLGNQVGNYPSHYNLPEGQKAFPGAVKLRDLDGNGVADTEDVADLGEITHPHTGGFNLNMTWKDIDFSAGFAWAAGGHVYNVNSLINMYGNKDTGAGANKLEFISDCYQIYDIQNGELVPVKYWC